jgi:16S rRNA (cytidine1402-2'-O)-methyltransferase
MNTDQKSNSDEDLIRNDETSSESADAQRPLAPGLYLVATPIGNLEDITLRALRVLRSVDRIACEDTRQTQKLLNHFDIRTPTVSYHKHNEAGRAVELATALKAGARIAVVSDAGTPGIADPGGQIAAAAIAAGVPVFPVPGPNAAISALIASGLIGSGPAGTALAGTSSAGDSPNPEQFTFHGFLPSKEGQRRTALEALRSSASLTSASNQSGGTQIFYEAPHRILATLADIESIFGPAQHVVVARELTKLHEEFLRGPVSEVRTTLAARVTVRGEIVLLFEPVAPQHESEAPTTSVATEVRELMHSAGLAEMDALKRVAKARGLGKSEAYREFQRGKGR